MGKTKNNRNRNRKKELSIENCNSQTKIGEKTKSKTKVNGKGRPKKKELEPRFFSSIRKVETLFLLSQAKQELIITENLYLWLVDEKEDKLTPLERYVMCVLWNTAGRGGELVDLEDKELVGNRLTLLTSKQRDDEDHPRIVTFPKFLVDLKDKLTQEGLIQEGYILRLDEEGTTQVLRNLLTGLSKRLYLSDLILKWSKGKRKNLTPHQFRRGRATQLYQSKQVNKDQLASFLGHKDTRSLPSYLPQENISFLDYIEEYDKGILNPIIGNLREDRLKELFGEVLDAKLIPILQTIKV